MPLTRQRRAEMREVTVAVNIRDESGGSALTWASCNGHPDTVQFLLENGADVDTRDKKGWSALTFACSYGHEEVVTLLLARGANINAINH
eukprot:gene29165-37629_t